MSEKTEAEIAKEYTEAGVDLPELKAPEAKEPHGKVEEPKPEEQPKEDAPKEEEPKEPLQKPEERKPRSIYDEYKDRKAELKTEKELRENAERERDELARKLEEAQAAKGTQDANETAEDAIAYAKKIGADPDLVQRIIKDAQKGQGTGIDESLKKDLEEFKAWKQSNSKTIETQRFNEEFESIVPTLKQQYPSASADELQAIKAELDAISHTKDWHKFDLDYIAFKNADKLNALVSPKKRGMESKDRKDVDDTPSEFNPSADLSKMSPEKREEWEKQYRAMGKTDGLMTDSQGRKTLL